MQFGVQVQHFRAYGSPEAIRGTAEVAEQMGYDSVWVTDHVVLPDIPAAKRFGSNFYDPFLALTWAAAYTDRVKLGTSVIITPYRNPLDTAKKFATLDALSGGRLIVGLGAGWMREEFDYLNVPFHQRGALTNEYIQVFKTLWTEEWASFRGKTVKFERVACEPKPIQKPHPPIWIGGGSEGALRRAVRFADVYHPTTAPPEKLAPVIAQLRELAQAAGRDPSSIGIQARGALKVLPESDRQTRRFSLVGTPDEIRASIRRYQEVGVQGFMLDTFYGSPEVEHEDTTSVLRSMERFALDIMPEFR